MLGRCFKHCAAAARRPLALGRVATAPLASRHHPVQLSACSWQQPLLFAPRHARCFAASAGSQPEEEEEEVDDLETGSIIRTLHKVQDILGHTFNFSRVVLVGDQSSGKTAGLKAVTKDT